MDGKRKQIYGKTRKEVAEALKILLREQQQGIEIAPERQTVAQFLTRWLRDVVEPRTRPATYQVYAYIVKQHLIPGLGQYQLAKLTPQHIQALLRSKREARLSSATIQRLREGLLLDAATGHRLEALYRVALALG